MGKASLDFRPFHRTQTEVTLQKLTMPHRSHQLTRGCARCGAPMPWQSGCQLDTLADSNRAFDHWLTPMLFLP